VAAIKVDILRLYWYQYLCKFWSKNDGRPSYQPNHILCTKIRTAICL